MCVCVCVFEIANKFLWIELETNVIAVCYGMQYRVDQMCVYFSIFQGPSNL